ncbi:ABC transporter substrate-binding protein [Rhodococcus sp. NPDC057014]|uniref:ABC transporter substrate-binding protein n=1 Tax=Rhodococcus sp. NPDC057014 TaxID=3346000 RepID=UPI003644DD87
MRTVMAFLLVAVTLSACGSGEGGASANGILKYGYLMSVQGINLDPAKANGFHEMVYYKLIQGSLLRYNQDGSVTPWMAKSVEIVDPTRVKISLREGVTFSDGTPFDAEAIRINLLRLREPLTPQAKGGQGAGIKVLDNVEVVDPLTAVATLSKPLAGLLYSDLTSVAGVMVSPKQIAEDPDGINTNPIGAGPFTVHSHAVGQRLSVRKNEKYWDAENIKLAGVDLINAPIGPQQANGLLSGQLDFASFISPNSAAAVDADKKYSSKVLNSTNIFLNMCTAKAPFDNADFRQAVQLGIDRERFSELAYGGLAEPAYGMIPEGTALFDPELKNIVKYDADAAKKLVADSGVSDPSFPLVYPATINLAVESETLQRQLEEVGISSTISAERDVYSGFMVPQKPGAMLVFTVGTAPNYQLFSQYFNGLQALCGVKRDDVMEALAPSASLALDDPAAKAAYDEAGRLIAENADIIPVVTYPNVQAWNKNRVTNEPTFDAQGFANLDQMMVSN